MMYTETIKKIVEISNYILEIRKAKSEFQENVTDIVNECGLTSAVANLADSVELMLENEMKRLILGETSNNNKTLN